VKVGILFHSHLRSFRNTQESFRVNVLDVLENAGHEYDIFVHTWDKEEFATKTWHEGAKKIIDTSLDEIVDIYKPKMVEVETQRLENLKKEIFGRPFTALKSVWYSFHRCFEMMKEYEKEHSIKYDVIIVTRPDVQHYSNIFLDELEDTNCVWQCQIFTKKGATDVLLYGGRDNIEKSVDGFYLNFDELNSDKNIKNYTNNEYIFNDYLESQTKVKKSQYCMPRDWRVLRSWWAKDETVGHRKWDKDLAVKDINSDAKYLYFRRSNDK
jgi:hypothetical protein